jgi:hypothetical protein
MSEYTQPGSAERLGMALPEESYRYGLSSKYSEPEHGIEPRFQTVLKQLQLIDSSEA